MVHTMYETVYVGSDFWLNTALGWSALWVSIFGAPLVFWYAVWCLSATAFWMLLGLVQGTGVALVCWSTIRRLKMSTIEN